MCAGPRKVQTFHSLEIMERFVYLPRYAYRLTFHVHMIRRSVIMMLNFYHKSLLLSCPVVKQIKKYLKRA